MWFKKCLINVWELIAELPYNNESGEIIHKALLYSNIIIF